MGLEPMTYGLKGRNCLPSCMAHNINEINDLRLCSSTNNVVIIVNFRQNTTPPCQILQPLTVKRLIAIFANQPACYLYGKEGITQNIVEGKRWINKAAECGHKGARELLLLME